MNILVTGGAGLIGSHLIDDLLSENNFVTVIDNLSFGNIRNVEKHIGNKQFLFIEADVQDINSLVGVFSQKKYDVVYHLASLKKVYDGSITNANILEANAKMSFEIAKFAKKHAAVVIFASTSDVYQNSPQFSEAEKLHCYPWVERTTYSLSKIYSEKLFLSESKQSGIDCIICRIFGCTSPRANFSWSGGHVPLFIKQAINNEPIIIHGDGSQTRSICHAKDIARGLFLLKNIDKKYRNQIYNIGTDEQTTVKSVAEYIIEKTNSRSIIKYIAVEQIFEDYEEVRVRYANCSKLKDVIDFNISYTTKDTIDEMIREFNK